MNNNICDELITFETIDLDRQADLCLEILKTNSNAVSAPIRNSAFMGMRSRQVRLT
jgi:hypothetical protein